MRIRTRTAIKVGPGAGNLTLVRNVYDPDLKRCREVYLGRLSGETVPAEVPFAITFSRGTDGENFSLKAEELEQLRAYLKPNAPRQLDPARALPKHIKAAAAALGERAKELARAGLGPDKELRSLIDAIRDAYEPDYKAQNPGLYGRMQKVGLTWFNH